MDYFSKRYHPMGTPPGTLVPDQNKIQGAATLQVVQYTKTECSVATGAGVEVVPATMLPDSIIWIHVSGTPSPQLLDQLGERFQLHPLALEDILNTGQRPKLEPFDDQLFVVLNQPVLEDQKINIQQMSFFLGENFVISFSQQDDALFSPVLKRLNDKGSRLRGRNADYLLYTLMDNVIDQGYPIMEAIGFQLEDLEAEILTGSDRATLTNIHSLKRELILLRRMLWPQRDVVSQLMHNDHALVGNETLTFLRDCYDHTVQIMDLLETYREMSGSLLEIYLSSVSNRMNETMRVLTVIATIFIPLTFIVGVYGMNFDPSSGPLSMPELTSPWGYPVVWLVMILISLGMLALFRRRGWF